MISALASLCFMCTILWGYVLQQMVAGPWLPNRTAQSALNADLRKQRLLQLGTVPQSVIAV